MTTPTPTKKVVRKKKPSLKSKVKKFLMEYMIFIAAAICTTALGTIWLMTRGGYEDKGDQLQSIVANDQVYVQNLLHGGSTSVPKDIRSIMRGANALPKGMSYAANGDVLSTYNKRATIMSYGKTIEIAYYDLTKRECKKAAIEENIQANAIAINDSIEFTHVNAEKYVDRLCALEVNKVAWSVRP